ncbi:hypothetical protein K461DRAFT_263552 [Myriangium duriaei CBS 260.36]|uniref:Zn(2)-C6 fungal-type domain-containing protein n=1 Tax=Myriangium duriaei CBS 260.36 TaxID=1168546 RepID=A0A9P4IVR1_9PEZI|nr:hypothetical protein K461DRAFT_263552 [Myriangium duriaei CBS 260.36]
MSCSLSESGPHVKGNRRNGSISKRSYIACHRCHSHKIKCSGGTPCRGCRSSSKPTQCIYPIRSRKILVPDTYIKALEAENQSLKENVATNSLFTPSSSNADQGGNDNGAGEEGATPIFEDSIRDGCISGISSHVYIGDAACAAFGSRIRHLANGGRYAVDTANATFFDHPVLSRCTQPTFELPSRTYAKVLVQVVSRFVGSDYHFMRPRKFNSELEKVYTNPAETSQNFICRLFGIFALGELYSKKSSIVHQGMPVPGTAFFVQAIALLQDEHERGDVEYIETLLTLSFYSLALNRIKSAYTYVGTALRLSLALGLHRNAPQSPGLSDEAIENRRRVWWTVYTYDRVLTSKLGFPLTFRDEDIDVALPSKTGSSGQELDDFVDPSHFLASIRLSRITGTILTLLYSLPAPKKGQQFVLNVHAVLTSLRQLDHELPETLKENLPTSVAQPRHVSSLRLNFNQCIILTTRPILLHVFRYYMQPTAVGDGVRLVTPSATVSALADACISAARQSHQRLIQLWIDGNLATYGYFDAHYLFSAMVVLCIATTLSPDTDDQDAIETGRELLKSMSEDGNAPASEYLDRLRLVQGDLTERQSLSGQSSHKALNKEQISDEHANPESDITHAPLEDPSLQDFFLDTFDAWGQDISDLIAGQDEELSLLQAFQLSPGRRNE